MSSSRFNDKRGENRCKSEYKHTIIEPLGDDRITTIQCVWTPGHEADGSTVFAYHLGPEERTPYVEGGTVRYAWLRRVWTDDEAIK